MKSLKVKSEKFEMNWAPWLPRVCNPWNCGSHSICWPSGPGDHLVIDSFGDLVIDLHGSGGKGVGWGVGVDLGVRRMIRKKGKRKKL